MKNQDSAKRAAEVADRVCRTQERAMWIAYAAGQEAEHAKYLQLYYRRWNLIFDRALAKYKAEEK